jgi:uncharacterized OB-fold protein
MSESVPIREGLFTVGSKGVTLLANKCQDCGQVFFPKALICYSCFGNKMQDMTLSSRGKLYSYTTAYMPSTHFEPPYGVGYVDMPEGVRIFTPLKIVANKPFKVGMEMEVVIEKLWQEDDKEIIGYKFKPV